MEHFYQNLGEKWFSYPTLYTMMVSKFPTDSHFVEIGSWKGMSAAYMAVEIINSGKKIKLDCIDIFNGVDYSPSEGNLKSISPSGGTIFTYDVENNNLYDVFLENTKPVSHIINPIKSISWEAANLYKDESLDFIFIDAAHDYASVKKDINAWFPKLKKEGIIAGHDYGTQFKGVDKAVHEFFYGKTDYLYSIEQCWVYNYSE